MINKRYKHPFVLGEKELNRFLNSLNIMIKKEIQVSP